MGVLIHYFGCKLGDRFFRSERAVLSNWEVLFWGFYNLLGSSFRSVYPPKLSRLIGAYLLIGHKH